MVTEITYITWHILNATLAQGVNREKLGRSFIADFVQCLLTNQIVDNRTWNKT